MSRVSSARGRWRVSAGWLGVFRTALGFGAALASASCATAFHPKHSGLPERTTIIATPLYPQRDSYCGPAALAMALGWSGLRVDYDEVIARVYTPGRDGSLRQDLIAGARRYERLVIPLYDLDEVVAELAEGHPVIVLQNLGLSWIERWHYALAVGYDLTKQEIVLRSGVELGKPTPIDLFRRTWERGGAWAIVVMPPEQLPLVYDEHRVLQAAAALESQGHLAAASAAYRAALARWPRSFVGAMGLGNVAYTVGDLTAAESAFRLATRFAPEHTAGWNNLAHVLSARGYDEEARLAQEKARALVDAPTPLRLALPPPSDSGEVRLSN